MTMESDAKEIAILDLIEVYLPRQTRFSSTSDAAAYDAEIDALVRSYQLALADVSAEAVARSVRQFITGQVERNHAFRPMPPEVAANARIWDQAIAAVSADRAIERARLVSYPIGGQPPEGMVPMGPIRVDFGRGTIDMTDMSPSEREAVLRHKGIPPKDGAKHIGVTPRLKSMGGA